MKTFKSLREFMDAVVNDQIPNDVLFLGIAAVSLGISRQALHQRLRRGTLRAWKVGGIILVDANDVRAARREKRDLQRVRERREQSNEGATAV